MPELPDVEQLRRAWEARIPGARVVRTVVTDAGILRGTTANALDAALRGERFEAPDRLGKWLIAHTTGPTVVLHFGMDGGLTWADGPNGRHRHDRVIFETDRGEMRFRNMRKLGGLWLAHDERELGAILGHFGPDALALSPAELTARLGTRRGQVKSALMDQSVVAGIGNLIADEVLWQARLNPKRLLQTLAPEELGTLVRTIRSVLREAVENYDGIERKRSWMWRVRGLPDAVCPRCGTPLERTLAAGRTTWFCPADQPPPNA